MNGEIGGIIQAITSRLTNTKLKGDELWASCPLGIHQDRNPSFSLSLSEEIYYCFTCQSSGTANQLAVKMGLREEGTYKPSFERTSKPKVIQPWQRAKRIGEAFNTVEDSYMEDYRSKRNQLELDWNEGRISEKSYYRDRQLLDHDLDCNMEVNTENLLSLSYDAKRGKYAKFECNSVNAN